MNRNYVKPENREFSPYKNTPEKTYILKGGGALELLTKEKIEKKSPKERVQRLPNYSEKYQRKRQKTPQNRKSINSSPYYQNLKKMRTSEKSLKNDKSDRKRRQKQEEKEKSLRSFKVSIKGSQLGENNDVETFRSHHKSGGSYNSKIDKSDGQVDAILQFYK